MDRQVAALFGGIVAVGLGPAVWLGGTLFRVEPDYGRPVPMVTQLPTESPTTRQEQTSDPLPTVPAGPVRGGPGLYPTETPLLDDPGHSSTPAPTGPVSPTPEPTSPAPESPSPSTSPSPRDPASEHPRPGRPRPGRPGPERPGPGHPGPGQPSGGWSSWPWHSDRQPDHHRGR